MQRLAVLLLMLLGLSAQADDWQLRYRDPARDIRVYQKPHPGSPYNDVYAVTRLTASARDIERILADVAGLPAWAPRVSAARVIRRQGNQAWIHLVYQLPYPFKPRDVVVLTERSDVDGQITLRSQAVRGLLRERPPTVRLYSLSSTWRLTGLPDGQLRIELWGSGEPGGIIPAMLYNYNVGEEALQTLRQLRRMADRRKYPDDPSASDDSP